MQESAAQQVQKLYSSCQICLMPYALCLMPYTSRRVGSGQMQESAAQQVQKPYASCLNCLMPYALCLMPSVEQAGVRCQKALISNTYKSTNTDANVQKCLRVPAQTYALKETAAQQETEFTCFSSTKVLS